MEENPQALRIRESRLASADKAVFPGLLRRLWFTLSPDDGIAGFRGSCIVPLDMEKMKRHIVLPQLMQSPVRQNDNNNNIRNPGTPNSAMRKAVQSVLAPEKSKDTEEILQNKSKKRTCVQAKTGEVLTTEVCARRLYLEQEARSAKKAQKGRKNAQRRPVAPLNYPSDELEEPVQVQNDLSDESEEENRQGTSTEIKQGHYVKVVK